MLLPSVCRGNKYSFDVDTTFSWELLETELRYSQTLPCAGRCEWIVLSAFDMSDYSEMCVLLQNSLFAADKQK